MLAASLNAQALPFYSVSAVSFYGNSYNPTPQSAGDVFTPTTDLIVSSLGFFDYQQNGLGESHEVGIFDHTGTLLTSTDVAAGTSSRLDGDFRYTDIAPLTLRAGETYTIAALLTTTADVIGYANVSGIQVDANINLDAFPGRYIFNIGPSLEFPTNNSTLPSSPFYVAPNFEFAPITSVPTQTQDGGTLAPGAVNAIGESTIAGDLTFKNGAKFAADLDLAGLTSDLLSINGTLNLGTDSLLELNFMNDLLLGGATEFQIVRFGGWDGNYFKGFADGYEFNGGKNRWEIDYRAGGIYLTSLGAAVVPEPSSLALLLLAAGLMGVRRHRQQA